MPAFEPSLPAALAERAARLGDREVLTFLASEDAPAETLTFAGLWSEARGLAARLGGMLPRGARVVLVYPNEAEMARLFCAILAAGMVAVPAAPPRNAAGLARLDLMVANAGAGLVLHAASLGPLLARLRGAVAPPEGAPPWLAGETVTPAPGYREIGIAPDDLAVIQYTSGSTGTQKGVMIPHRNLGANSAALASVCGTGPGMRMVAWLPFFHDWGLFGCLVFPLMAEGRAWLLDPGEFLRSPRRWIELMSEHRATVSCAPDFAYRLAADWAEPGPPLDLSAWRMAMLGAEPIRAATLDAFAAAYGPHGFRAEALYPSYGLAENTLIATGGPPGVPWRQAQGPSGQRVTNCGRPLAGQRIAVVDPATGADCAPGAAGELWVSGPSVAAGYWRNPEATAAVFGARRAGEAEGAWLRTGDLAFVAEGDVHICGRIKDVIIRGGENHLAEDIEHAIEGAHPGLRPTCSAAFGIEAAGAERLVIVAEVNYGPRPPVAEIVPAIQKAMGQKIGSLADAVAILPPGRLEKTSSGKIRRAQTRALFLAGQLEPLLLWQGWKEPGGQS